MPQATTNIALNAIRRHVGSALQEYPNVKENARRFEAWLLKQEHTVGRGQPRERAADHRENPVGEGLALGPLDGLPGALRTHGLVLVKKASSAV